MRLFLAVADEWLLTKKASLTESSWARDRQQIHKWEIPYLGTKPIASIEAPDLLEVLERIEADLMDIWVYSFGEWDDVQAVIFTRPTSQHSIALTPRRSRFATLDALR